MSGNEKPSQQRDDDDDNQLSQEENHPVIVEPSVILDLSENAAIRSGRADYPLVPAIPIIDNGIESSESAPTSPPAPAGLAAPVFPTTDTEDDAEDDLPAEGGALAALSSEMVAMAINTEPNTLAEPITAEPAVPASLEESSEEDEPAPSGILAEPAVPANLEEFKCCQHNMLSEIRRPSNERYIL